MTDDEILETVKRFIPVDMESSFDFCLLQAFFVGHAEGVRMERQKCKEVIDELAAEALARIIRQGEPQ